MNGLAKLVGAGLVALTTIAGSAVATLSWLESRFAGAEDMQGLKEQVWELRYDAAKRQRAIIRSEQFQIRNTLQLERRRPTTLENERLDQLQQESTDVEATIKRIEPNVKR